MSHVITYAFKPIQNFRQELHIISISERLKRGKNSVLKPHRTDFCLLFLVTHGKSTHIVDFNEVNLEKGDVLFVNPGQVHAFREGENYDGWIIAFTKDFFFQSANDKYFLDNAYLFKNLLPVTRLNLDDNELRILLDIVGKLSHELEGPYDSLQHHILHNYLFNLLLFSERKFIKSNIVEDDTVEITKDKILVIAFKDLISKNFRQQMMVRYYAKELAVSERTLQKAVISLLGKSPKVLINEQIILESKRLLIHEFMTVKEVGYDLGFDEPSNFSKFFTKHTGVSPTHFKNQNQLL